VGKVRIGLIGARGRLGREICLLEHPEVETIEQFHRDHLPNRRADVDLFLDVSSHEALKFNLQAALDAGKPIVIGTTGLIDFHLLQEASKKIPIFYSANFSIKMALLNACVEQCSHFFNQKADVRIVETHHSGKKDAPSGSALFLSQTIEQVLGKAPAIHSIREGTIVGEHSVIFQGDGEEITLTHKALHRKIFAQGAIIASLFLVNQPPGLYSMKDLLTSLAYGCYSGSHHA
jgi:4-hydroxy-tetrahydrodipicolinate reductase